MSTYVTRAAEHHARMEDGRAAMREWEHEHGAFTADEITDAEADGVLLADSRTSDAVDAIVVTTAVREHGTIVVTSAPDDLGRLLAGIGDRPRPGLLVV